MFPAEMAARLPLQLTPEQRHAYVEVAHGVRDDTIALYEAYLARAPESQPFAPAFDPLEWKLLKKKEQFQIFASRHKHPTPVYRSPSGQQSPIHQSAEWVPQCTLRCVGSFVGSLDELMYGGVIPTDRSMMVRSLTIHDEFIDHQTLCDITIPTEEDPFTYLGLKWSARPPYLATMIKPREFTYVLATGFCTMNNKGNNERVAFHVYHSMGNLPGWPELIEYGFLRSCFSLSVIFRPTEAGTINVFATTAVNAGGDLPRQLTIMFSAAALVAIPKASGNALQKKLVWLRATQTERTPTLDGTPHPTVCLLCSHDISLLNPLRRCGVCGTRVCRRCISAHTLVFGHTKATLRPVNVPTCRACLTAAAKMNVRELAILEFVRPFESGYVDSLRSTAESISSDLSRESMTGSFFGRRISARFFSFSSVSEAESERSSHDN